MIERLFSAIDVKQSAVVVGLDPVLNRLPRFLVLEAAAQTASPAAAAIAALGRFNQAILQAVAPFAPAVKLQKACYEVYGAAGITLFEETARQAQALGLIVIDDSKRGDIGSTAALYAQALIGPQSNADFVTVNPYLGWDGIEPFLHQADANDKGVFVLTRTSNPSAGQYQEAMSGSIPLYLRIAQDLAARASARLLHRGYGNLGAVVGATWPEEAIVLRQAMPGVLFLVPGYGAQGGSAADAVPCFDAQGYGALINSSRGIIFAFAREDLPTSLQGETNFAEAAAWAAQAMKNDLAGALQRAGKLPSTW